MNKPYQEVNPDMKISVHCHWFRITSPFWLCQWIIQKSSQH